MNSLLLVALSLWLAFSAGLGWYVYQAAIELDQGDSLVAGAGLKAALVFAFATCAALAVMLALGWGELSSAQRFAGLGQWLVGALLLLPTLSVLRSQRRGGSS